MKYVVVGLTLVTLYLPARSGGFPSGNDPGGDFYFNATLTSHGGKRYALGQLFKANWYKAFMYCRRNGMMLASVDNEEEFNLLVATMKAAGFHRRFKHTWVSGTDAGEEGEYSWLSTGRPLSYANWWPGEPNNRNEGGNAGTEENCLVMDVRHDNNDMNIKYNDNHCLQPWHIACEYFPNQVDFDNYYYQTQS